MYKWAVRTLVRHGIQRLNDGDPSFLLRLAHPDIEFTFPGDNSWASMHRPVEKGRERHVTHRGVEECRAFAERFVDAGLHIDIEDILVNGGPWDVRVVVRGTDLPGAGATGRGVIQSDLGARRLGKVRALSSHCDLVYMFYYELLDLSGNQVHAARCLLWDTDVVGEAWSCLLHPRS